MTPIAPHACAVCGDDIWESPPRTAQLGIDDSFVPICEPCDVETPRELRGPRSEARGYTGGAGPRAPRADEMAAASRRAIGDAYDRDIEITNELGRRPAPPTDRDAAIFADVKRESHRQARVRRGDKNAVKYSAARDVARKVKPRKSSGPSISKRKEPNQ